MMLWWISWEIYISECPSHLALRFDHCSKSRIYDQYAAEPQRRKVHKVVIDSSGLSGILHAPQVLHCPSVSEDSCSWKGR